MTPLPNPLYALIMAGGRGLRLWPESRKNRPKQFLTRHNKTLLAGIVDCISPPVPMDRLLVTTRCDLESLVYESIPSLTSDQLLLEPSGKNTAPCIALGALRLLQQDPEATMIVLPCDLAIDDRNAFRRVISTAVDWVEHQADSLVLLAIPPTHPSTQFGYLQGEAISESTTLTTPATPLQPFHVVRFHEKPGELKAMDYIRQGNYWWNSGIFIWKARAFLEQLAYHRPKWKPWLCSEESLLDHWDELESISIDYALLEHSDRVVAFPAAIGWNDLGSFAALAQSDIPQPDENQNRLGDNVVTLRSSGNTVRNAGKQLIGLIGIEDMIVVVVEDAILLCKKGEESSIPLLLDEIRRKKLDEYL